MISIATDTTKAKNILVILGHPASDSYCKALVDSYVSGVMESRKAREDESGRTSGDESRNNNVRNGIKKSEKQNASEDESVVGADTIGTTSKDESLEASEKTIRTFQISKLSFSRDMDGYKSDAELEPDLIKAQELIKWADHLTFIFPIWWSGMPSVMKSFIERVFVPGFAFKYKKNPRRITWDKLLTGKSATIIMTMDAPPFYYRWFVGNPAGRMLKTGILNFCGVHPVKQYFFGSVKMSSEQQKKKWIDKVYTIGLHE